jgi:hypothetical protein
LGGKFCRYFDHRLRVVTSLVSDGQGITRVGALGAVGRGGV